MGGPRAELGEQGHGGGMMREARGAEREEVAGRRQAGEELEAPVEPACRRAGRRQAGEGALGAGGACVQAGCWRPVGASLCGPQLRPVPPEETNHQELEPRHRDRAGLARDAPTARRSGDGATERHLAW